ncbi:unnamed protein product [Schistosoma margrebowiei]|uniref:Uncharacterized protein n=1 Tax=Schistosoma margrebowiei TaxID=48269 RepID=A0A183ME43_9TREM|nr:unnamed protein product [Schistosoma margrebowiei]
MTELTSDGVIVKLQSFHDLTQLFIHRLKWITVSTQHGLTTNDQAFSLELQKIDSEASHWCAHDYHQIMNPLKVDNNTVGWRFNRLDVTRPKVVC